MRILLTIDDSTFSEAATRVLIGQARPQEAKVHLIHVIAIPSPQLPEMMACGPGVEHARDAQRGAAEAIVAKAAALLRSNGLEVTAVIELGNPKAKILDAAEKWHADLIVLGSHYGNGLKQLLLGSVAEAVVRPAHGCVELVRVPNDR